MVVIDFQSVLTDLLGPDAGEPAREAIRAGDEQMVRELNLIDLPTMSLKLEAIIQGRPEFLKLSLENDGAISEDLVAAACQHKNKDCVRMLLDWGWDINRAIYFVASLLGFAVDDVEFMRWLIENGADVDVGSNLDEPALAVAIIEGDIRVVRFLLDLGVDTTHGNLLHCAAERCNMSEGAELVDYLAQSGADMNAYPYNNPVARWLRAMSRLPTPLHVACDKGNIPVARALLQHNADPNRMVLEAGKLVPPTVVESARENGHQELLELLSKAAA